MHLNTNIGALIEEPGIFPNLSAWDNLHLKAIAQGVTRKGHENELLHLVGLENVGKKKTKGFSLGMRQRLGIALAMVGNPDLVLLDEPINGLDPQGIVEIRELILKLNREKNITFIISSHLLEELSRIATSYGFISGGKLVAEMTKEELESKSEEVMILDVSDTAKTIPVLDSLCIKKYKVISNELVHIYDDFDKADNISIELAKNGVAVRRLAMESKDLESFYLDMVGGSANV